MALVIGASAHTVSRVAGIENRLRSRIRQPILAAGAFTTSGYVLGHLASNPLSKILNLIRGHALAPSRWLVAVTASDVYLFPATWRWQPGAQVISVSRAGLRVETRPGFPSTTFRLLPTDGGAVELQGVSKGANAVVELLAGAG